MLAGTTFERKPISFQRSNTTVYDDEVVIGERRFPMHDIVGAQVWDITAGMYLVDLGRREQAKRLTTILLCVAAIATIASIFLDNQNPVSETVRAIYTLSWSLYLLLTVWTVPGYRPFFKKHEYYLTLNTRSGPEDVISGFDLKYLDEIAKDINTRSRGNDTLPRLGT